MAADDEQAAKAFEQFARHNGWKAKPIPVTHRDHKDKRRKIAGWSVVARRDDEVVTVTWIDGAAIGPIGWHSSRTTNSTIKNQSAARKIIRPES